MKQHPEHSGGVTTLTVLIHGGCKLLCSNGHLDRSRWWNRIVNNSQKLTWKQYVQMVVLQCTISMISNNIQDTIFVCCSSFNVFPEENGSDGYTCQLNQNSNSEESFVDVDGGRWFKVET